MKIYDGTEDYIRQKGELPKSLQKIINERKNKKEKRNEKDEKIYSKKNTL